MEETGFVNLCSLLGLVKAFKNMLSIFVVFLETLIFINALWHFNI